MPHWSLSFGAGSIGVFADAILLFVAAVSLMTYLGVGLSALLLPWKLRSAGWLVAPYLGYSLLATICCLAISIGGNVAISLSIALALATMANCLALIRSRQGARLLGNPRWWLLLLGLALPSYMVTAVSMAHTEALGYVGPSSDPIWFIRMAEWLKTHSAPVFSASSPSLIAPFWNASFPPMDGWFRQGLSMGFKGDPYDEAYWIFSRGPRYLDASIGLLLGWDAALVFRPAQALMLSLSIPATFLFCRKTVQAGNTVSLLAAALVGVNSTIYFWVYLGHPGQASWVFMLPVVLCVSMLAMEGLERGSALAAALMVTALFASYYQAALVLPGLIGMGFLHYLTTKPRERLRVLATVVAIAMGVLVLALPEHVKMLVMQLGSGMYQAVGWGDPGIAPLSDALGTTLSDVSVGLIAGKGQIDKATISTWQAVSSAVSAIALVFTGLGLVLGRSPGMHLYRLLLLGDLVMLEYLRQANYGYGHTKLQSMTTFLFSVALAAGIVESWQWARRAPTSGFQDGLRRKVAVVPAVAAVAIVACAAGNLALVAGSYWKMDRNLFNTAQWEAAVLPKILPAGTATRMSPSLIGEPQTVFFADYFLRNQQVQGPFALEWVWQRLILLPEGERSIATSVPAYELLGASEVASVHGLAPSDRIWSGSIMKAYRRPASNDRVEIEVRGQKEQNGSLPVLLPATVRISPKDASPQDSARSDEVMVVSLLSQGPASVMVSTPYQQQSVQVGSGLTVRSVSVQAPDQVILAADGDSPVAILSLELRSGTDGALPPESYPRVLAMSGSSTQQDNRITTKLIHFDDRVPAAHSFDIFSSPTGVSHVGWFSLPPLLGGRIREIDFEIDAFNLQHKLLIDGTVFEPQHSIFPDSKPDPNGEFVGYLSTTYGGTNPNRIPLFRYRLKEGIVADFEPFPLRAAWDESHTLRNWK